MKLLALPAFADNYIWMLHDGTEALVVDPGDGAVVIDALARETVRLAAVLVTHHHSDHTGGVDALRAATGAPIFGPARESIPQPFEPLAQGQQVECLGLRFSVLDVPGHTAGHIAYYCEVVDGSPLLFCGDTLFSAGCGRLFEGTATQMLASLESLAHLPSDTRVCCTHEYTLNNLKFALAVEPSNPALQSHARNCQALREVGKPTLPSTIALERQINPFLRSHLPDVIAAARRHDAQAVAVQGTFATLRQWKNDFR
jgi:hydroxyacylglutathione hydrolase